MELLLSLETVEFLGALKRFIARRGRPTKIYSDNGKTFVAAAKWLEESNERRNDSYMIFSQIKLFHGSLISAERRGGEGSSSA